MKFVSKNSNLRIILTPSIQAEPLAGRAQVRGLFVKFEDGVANVIDEDIISRMLAHQDYGTDFIAAEEGSKDPFIRRSIEPEHNITDIEFGHVGKNKNPATVMSSMTPELKKALTDMAMNMAQQMAEKALADATPKLVERIKQEMVKNNVVGSAPVTTNLADDSTLNLFPDPSVVTTGMPLSDLPQTSGTGIGETYPPERKTRTPRNKS